MIEALAEKTSFSAGEISEALHYRANLARHQAGVGKAENVVVMVEGGLERRPGSRFQFALKNQAQRGKQFAFRYTTGDSYVLVFNGGVMRVKRAGGYVLSGGAPYELTIPYAEADLPNMRARQVGNTLYIVCRGHPPRALTRVNHDNWTLGLYQSIGGPVKSQNLDKTKVLVASAVTGTANLTGIGTNWQVGDIGSVIRIDESDLSLIPLWKANETLTPPLEALPAGTNIGDMTNPANAFDGSAGTFATKAANNAWIGRTYAAPTAIYSVTFTTDQDGFLVKPPATTALVTIAVYARDGAAPANKTDGTLLGTVSFLDFFTGGLVTAQPITLFNPDPDPSVQWDHVWYNISGDGTGIRVHSIDPKRFTAGSAPIRRRWQGRVYEAVVGGSTGLEAPTHEEGNVLATAGGVVWAYRHRDRGFARITAVTDATHATALVLETLPYSVLQSATYRFFDGAWSVREGWPDRIHLHAQRLVFARGNKAWMTRPSDINSLEEIEGDDDSAVSFSLLMEDGSLADIEWMLSGAVLVLGLKDGEWIARPALLYDTINIANLKARPKKSEGSATHIPAAIDGGALFIGRTRKRLHYIKFDDESEAIDVKEVSLSARHILNGKAQNIAWQRDPNRIAWVQCEDGTLVGLTFNPEEQIIGWHRHPMTNGVLEDVVTVAADDEQTSELHLIVRRTINGLTRRYTEILTPFFEPINKDDPTAEGAWFVDSGLRYQGEPKTVFDIPHLIGQEVAIHADGAMRKRQVVASNGTVTLDRAASDVIIGLPIAWKARGLPVDMNAQKGSTKGEQKKTNHVVIDMQHAAGGYVSVNGGRREDIHPSGNKPMGSPIALRTGSFVVGPVESSAAAECVIEVGGENTMPFRLLGMSPELIVLEG